MCALCSFIFVYMCVLYYTHIHGLSLSYVKNNYQNFKLINMKQIESEMVKHEHFLQNMIYGDSPVLKK